VGGLSGPDQPGTIDAKALGNELFPFDAWEFEDPSKSAPVLRLKSPWKLALGAASEFYSPVASEPSSGTWHDIKLPGNGTLLNQIAVATTWYTVTFSIGSGSGDVPVGTKKVKAPCRLLYSGTINAYAHYRPYGSAWGLVVGASIIGIYATGVGVFSNSHSQVELPIDSSGRVQIACDSSGPTILVYSPFAYSM
jgi:hypothetical protein